VLLPVSNGADCVGSAIASILEQTFVDFELILVEDGSTDHSAQVLRDWAKRDDRIRVFTLPQAGIVGALNDGLAYARGSFIARMDADDLSYPHRLQKQVDHLRQHPEIGRVPALSGTREMRGFRQATCSTSSGSTPWSPTSRLFFIDLWNLLSRTRRCAFTANSRSD